MGFGGEVPAQGRSSANAGSANSGSVNAGSDSAADQCANRRSF
jgi:hypothetical protein